MNGHAKFFLACGGISAAVSVVIGAAIAHAANSQPLETVRWLQTGLQYHQFHALGLMMTGLIADRYPASRCLVGAGWLMIVGTVLFSGNLYLRSLASFQGFHAITPLGGGAFIAAWLLLVAAVLRQSRGSTTTGK